MIIRATPNYKNIRMFIENLEQKQGFNNRHEIQRGYETGCLGVIFCTMRDSCLYNYVDIAGNKDQNECRGCPHHVHSAILWRLPCGIYIPTEEDAGIKEYFRMCDCHKMSLKKVKQQPNVFCFSMGTTMKGKNRQWRI